MLWLWKAERRDRVGEIDTCRLMFLFLLYKLGGLLTLALQLRIGYALAGFIADMKWALSPRDRKFVSRNLISILGGYDDKIPYYTREVFRNFARYLVDFFRFQKLDRRFIMQNVKI